MDVLVANAAGRAEAVERRRDEEVEDGRLLGRRAVGSLAMVDDLGGWPEPALSERRRLLYVLVEGSGVGWIGWRGG